jgi:hypothetical protein
MRLEIAHDGSDAVETFEHRRHGLGTSDHFAFAQLAEDILSGVRHRFEARQTEEPAGAFHGVDQTEDVSEQFRVVRILLELDQLNVQNGKILRGFRQELTQQIIHMAGSWAG